MFFAVHVAYLHIVMAVKIAAFGELTAGTAEAIATETTLLTLGEDYGDPFTIIDEAHLEEDETVIDNG